MKKLIVIVFTFFSIGLCAQPCLDSWCYEYRKKMRFRTPKQFTDGIKSDLVKYNGVYVEEFTWKDSSGIDQTYFHFYRFFENGSVFKSCSYCTYPSNEELNSFSRGYKRYFTIVDGLIRIENYTGKAGYFYEFFSVTENSFTAEYSLSRTRIFKPTKQFAVGERKFTFHPCELISNALW